MERMKVGIDRISFYCPAYFLDLRSLAAARGADPSKYLRGLGQERMAVAPPDEDIVTMGASAALPILEADGADDLDWLLFATETGVDQSKAAAMFVHGLLELPAACAAIEIKQACYSGTAALQFACAWVAAHPDRAVLIVAADIARYELGSPGEPTQGAGAVAFRVCSNPRLLALDPVRGAHAEDVMDFWRPNYREEALVDGQYSTRVYLNSLAAAWQRYRAAGGRAPEEFARLCVHLPFTRIAEKAVAQLQRVAGWPAWTDAEIVARLADGLRYNRQTGNTYAASLYESLAATLDTATEDLSGAPIGLYSYGSGCAAEFFSGVVQPGYHDALFAAAHARRLEDRLELDCRQYEDIVQLPLPRDGRDHVFAQYRTGPFRFAGMSLHKRVYERL